MVFAIDRAVTTTRWGCSAASVPARRARAASVAGRGAFVIPVPVTIVAMLIVRLAPAARGRSRHSGESRRNRSGTTHVQKLQSRAPVLWRDPLGLEESQELKLLLHRRSIRHCWGCRRLSEQTGQRIGRRGQGVRGRILTLRLSHTSESSIRIHHGAHGSIWVGSGGGHRGWIGGRHWLRRGRQEVQCAERIGRCRCS